MVTRGPSKGSRNREGRKATKDYGGRNRKGQDRMTTQEYSEKRMSVYMACYCYSYYYHGGQNTRAYRLGCTIRKQGFNPGPYGVSETELRETDAMAEELLDRLIARNY